MNRVLISSNLFNSWTTGSVAVKNRSDIVDDFNRQDGGAQVMLLSLGAGGVGLNLVGANHLFLLDMHWNPQLERQVNKRVNVIMILWHLRIFLFNNNFPPCNLFGTHFRHVTGYIALDKLKML